MAAKGWFALNKNNLCLLIAENASAIQENAALIAEIDTLCSFALCMDGVKLRKAVVPGDQLILTAETVKSHTRTAQCKCKAMVGNTVVAECEIKFMLVDNDKL